MRVAVRREEQDEEEEEEEEARMEVAGRKRVKAAEENCGKSLVGLTSPCFISEDTEKENRVRQIAPILLSRKPVVTVVVVVVVTAVVVVKKTRLWPKK